MDGGSNICCRALLVLVIYCNAAEFLALRVLATRGDDAEHAISRDDDPTARDIILGFPDIEPQRTVVDPRIRSRI